MISDRNKRLIKEFGIINKEDRYRVRKFHSGELDFIIDIGANIGIFSAMMRFLHPNSKIVAVEPYKESLKYLKPNMEMLEVEVCEYAFGDGRKFIEDTNPGRNSLLAKTFLKSKDNTGIESFGLKDIFDRYNLSIRDSFLLKFDCEGGEQYMIGDMDAENIISQSVQTSLEIHFQSPGTPFDFWPKYEDYNNWIRDKFASTHNIDYYCSKRNDGYGHYCILRKDFYEKSTCNGI